MLQQRLLPSYAGAFSAVVLDTSRIRQPSPSARDLSLGSLLSALALPLCLLPALLGASPPWKWAVPALALLGLMLGVLSLTRPEGASAAGVAGTLLSLTWAGLLLGLLLYNSARGEACFSPPGFGYREPAHPNLAPGGDLWW